MATKDERIDAYITASQPFARPILKHLRSLVHKACPEVHETIKWGFPHFEYGGKILCSVASFKEHCAFGFRLGVMMSDPKGILKQVGSNSGMGHFGKISSLDDLPSEKTIIQYIKEAMTLTDEGVSKPKVNNSGSKELEMPDYFVASLKKDKQAHSNFEKFSYSKKKDYVEWITEAKTEATRKKRMDLALEWLREGKGRNWKYEK